MLCSNLVEHVPTIPSSSTNTKPLKITTNLLRGLYFLLRSPWKLSGNILLYSELFILQNLIWFKERRQPLSHSLFSHMQINKNIVYSPKKKKGDTIPMGHNQCHLTMNLLIMWTPLTPYPSTFLLKSILSQVHSHYPTCFFLAPIYL